MQQYMVYRHSKHRQVVEVLAQARRLDNPNVQPADHKEQIVPLQMPNSVRKEYNLACGPVATVRLVLQECT